MEAFEQAHRSEVTSRQRGAVVASAAARHAAVLFSANLSAWMLGHDTVSAAEMKR